MAPRAFRPRSSRGALAALASAVLAACCASSLLAAGRPGVSTAGVFSVRDWRLKGEVGADSWKTSATYSLEGGHAVKIAATGVQGNVNDVGAGFDFKSPGRAPDVGVSAAFKPKTGYISYRARLSKRLDKHPAMPTVAATITDKSVALETSLKRQMNSGLTLQTSLQLPYTFKQGSIDPMLTTEASYPVAGGKFVGTMSSQGPRKTRWAAKFSQF